MSWWGKLLGGYIGFALGGPIGALLGGVIGHKLDKNGDVGAAINRRNQSQAVFFTATFSLMGHLCKADGRVTNEEIETARGIMSRMYLSPQQREAAIKLFNAGKEPDFPLRDVLLQLKNNLAGNPDLERFFMEIQCTAAMSDGKLHPNEKKLLKEFCRVIDFAEDELNHILDAIAAEQRQAGHKTDEMPLEDAYAVLNLPPKVSTHEVKRAYRKLISQHHPDKLVSQGLPDEMIKIATEKTREIRRAYETIMAEKNA